MCDSANPLLQRILETLEIDAALREMGVKDRDVVLIGEYELEWAD